MKTPKTPKKDTTRLQGISLKELQEDWPKSADGKLCARLLQRYMYSRLVDTSAEAECNAITAQAESGSAKAMASMTKDFATLAMEVPAPQPGMTLPTLNRFGGGSRAEEAKAKQTPKS